MGVNSLPKTVTRRRRDRLRFEPRPYCAGYRATLTTPGNLLEFDIARRNTGNLRECS